LSALGRNGGELNDSKGCGGIMRVAPCGVLHVNQPSLVFHLCSQAAKLTHGHPTLYLSAGMFAALIVELMPGNSLKAASDTARVILIGLPERDETLRARDAARRAAADSVPLDEAIPVLSERRVAEEALAIFFYFALRAESLEEGIVTAVNITGDSDSTGAITGNLLGALHGARAIPQRWLDTLELRDVIEMVARDLAHVPGFDSPVQDEGWLARYPAC
jgi:ADP-ribosylglycohydrolase